MTTTAIALLLFVALMYVVGFAAQRRIVDEEDFLVAGRRLPLPMASATLLATWFGAGTILSAADEVRRSGLQAIALEPLGSGVCLLIAGFFFAAPLWKMRLYTLCDFFAIRFGRKAELLSGWIMVPSYFGWIAAQFQALAAMLELLFGIPTRVGLVVVAIVGSGYTLLGGMWSVTLTDAVQIVFVLGGLVLLTGSTLGTLGDGNMLNGLERLVSETPPEMLQIVPRDDMVAIFSWIGVFCIAALGNIPGQDLMQRIFAAKSPSVAKKACWLSGGAYILFGLAPVTMALASRLILPDHLNQAILPALSQTLMNPFISMIFLLTLVAAVLSTIDSAILSPSTVISQNLLSRVAPRRFSPISMARIAILFVTVASLLVSYAGESAYSLLEDAYALTLAGLFVPLTFGLYGKKSPSASALASMITGSGVWFLHLILGWESFLEPVFEPYSVELPTALLSAGFGLIAYLIPRLWVSKQLEVDRAGRD